MACLKRSLSLKGSWVDPVDPKQTKNVARVVGRVLNWYQEIRPVIKPNGLVHRGPKEGDLFSEPTITKTKNCYNLARWHNLGGWSTDPTDPRVEEYVEGFTLSTL